jgi:hypothetical protein
MNESKNINPKLPPFGCKTCKIRLGQMVSTGDVRIGVVAQKIPAGAMCNAPSLIFG